MQIKALNHYQQIQESYQQQIADIQKELDQEFTTLKEQTKAVNRTKKRIKKLVEKLEDLRYRAAF